MNSIAIIGGGMTGLAAAFALRERGVAFTLYEAGSRCGGVVNTVRRDGFIAECGPHTIMETSPRITELVRAAGCESQRLESSPEAKHRYIVRGGVPVSLPGSPLGFFTSKLFGASAKLHLLREPFVRRARGEENLATFVRRRLGQEFLDYAINPFVAGVFAGDLERLSVRYAFPKLHALEQRYGSLILGQVLGARERKRRGEISKQNAPRFSFVDGLGSFTAALEAKLGDAVRLRSRVTRLRPIEGEWEVTHEQQPRHIETGRHAAVLLVAPAHKLVEIEIGSPALPEGWRPLATLRYSPVATVALGFRREDVTHPLDGFGVLIPEVERFNILGTIFASSLFPNRAPTGHVLLTSYVGGARAPELTALPPERLIVLTLGDLRRMLGVRGRPVFQNVAVYRQAIPQYEMNFGALLKFMSEAEARLPGLFLAGHFRDGTSMSDTIVAGYKAAGRIEEFLRTRRTSDQAVACAA